MRVALELQPCCGKRSGIGMYTYEIAKRLKDSEDMEFCGNLFNFIGRNDNSAALQGITMPIQESRLFPYGVYRRIWNYVPIPYQSLFPKAVDLTIFFNYIAPPCVNGKIISVIHDLTYLRYPETMERKNLSRLNNGLQSTLERSAQVVTVSEFSKREIQELLDVPTEKISVVPCAPVDSHECADWDAVATKFQIKTPYLLYVGTIEPRKNLTRLIQAFDHLKKEHYLPHKLMLAGGKGWADEKIYQAAKQTAFCDEIYFTGYISQAEKNALYQHADVFTFPSLYEGFGIPPLEAMEWGCPVVCSHAASLPEVVGDAAQLVDPLDVKSIAGGIWRILSDEEYAGDMIQMGKKQRERFSWDKSAEKMVEICKSVLGEV